MTGDNPAADGRTITDLLCDCLRFDTAPSLAGELAGRIAQVGWDPFLAYAEAERLNSVLVRAIDRLGLAPSVPAVTLPDGRMTVTRALAQREADELARRRILAERLREITKALNAAGIVPIAIKGARSLVTGHPDWRHLRDIDLLLPTGEAERAQAVVQSLGYRPPEVVHGRGVRHHLPELFRDDMPGWIEIHRRAGTVRVEAFLPSAELAASSVSVRLAKDMEIRILPPPIDILLGVTHYHLGHRAVIAGSVPFKGMYEFAAAVVALSEADRTALAARAARHPRLLAILDLWTAAAADLYGMPVNPPLAVPADAAGWWTRLRSKSSSGDKGIGLERRAATDLARMRRARGGANPLRRLLWRATMPFAFTRHPILPPGSR